MKSFSKSKSKNRYINSTQLSSMNNTFNGGRNKTETEGTLPFNKTKMSSLQNKTQFPMSKSVLTTTNSLIHNPGIQQYYTPIRKEEEQEFNEMKQLNELDEVQKLKKLFLLYSSNEKKLLSQKFLKLLSDAKVLDKNFDSKYADIIFYTASKSRNNVDFNEFCEIMVKVSEIKFPSEFMKNQSIALNKLLDNHLFPLLNLIVESSEKNKSNENKICNWEIYLTKLNKRQNIFYIEKNFYCIAKIYSKYFPWEPLNVSNYQKANLSEKSFNKLCRDLEICPHIVSLVKLNEIFQNILINTKLITNVFSTIENILREEENKMSISISNLGTYFTLYHLISAFYLVGIQNMINLNMYNNEFIIDNFGLDEDSKAFHELIQNFYRTEAIREIFPNHKANGNSINVYNNINVNSSTIKTNSQPHSRSHSPFKIEDEGENTRRSAQSENNIEIENNFFEKYQEILTTVYKYYSDLYSDNSFSIFMNLKGFIKFMKDCGLVNLENVKEDKNTHNTKNNNQSSLLSYLTINKKTNSRSNFSTITQSKSTHSNPNKQPTLKEKIQKNLFSFNTINLLFSKFSSETYIHYKHVESNSSKLTREANKKINFNSFFKILLCISNKLFNNRFNTISFETQKDFNLDKLLTSDSKHLQQYFELFIGNYIKPCYNGIKSFLEKESYDLLLLNKVSGDKNIEEFFGKMRPVLYKIFKLYSDGRDFLQLHEFMKILSDFEIFPDLIAKTKVIHLFINFVNDFDQVNVIGGDPNFFIEFDSFVGILIFIAVRSKLGGEYLAGSEVMLKRILYFFQRMVQSRGLEKIGLYTGNARISNEFTNTFNKFKYFIEEPAVFKKSFRDIIIKKK